MELVLVETDSVIADYGVLLLGCQLFQRFQSSYCLWVIQLLRNHIVSLIFVLRLNGLNQQENSV